MQKRTGSLFLFFALLMLFSLAVAQDEQKEATVKSEEKAVEFQIIKVDSFKYVAVEMTGSFEQHGDAFQTIYAEASMQGLGTDWVPFGIYYNDPSSTPVDELKWEVGFALSGEHEVKAPLKVKTWGFTQVATRTYEGAFESEAMGNAYVELFDWFTKKGYQPAGPVMERFVSMPEQNAEGQWVGKLEIWMPVVKVQ
jgi:predicted transcriptional regulator YdeE